MGNLSSLSKVHYLTIDCNNQDERLDNLIYNFFKKNLARSKIQELIRTGQVRVNKCRAKHNYRLQPQDLVRIPPVKLIIDPKPIAILSNNSQQLILNKLIKHWQQQLEQAILFENNNLLIINKPFGLAVHGGSNIPFGLIEILRKVRQETPFLELIHRLDRDTSGCVMIAKSRSYLKKLHLMLRTGQITKTYSAIVKGLLERKKIIELPLKKFINSSREHIVKVCDEGNYAKTICLPERNFKIIDQEVSLIIIRLMTGKTHQIRVHLAEVGLPIINDDKYGDRKFNLLVNKFYLKRMLLHAIKLDFICPVVGNRIVVEAPYDPAIKQFLLNVGVNIR